MSMKNLTLPKLKKRKLLLEVKLMIINKLINIPFHKRESYVKELEQLIKKK